MQYKGTRMRAGRGSIHLPPPPLLNGNFLPSTCIFSSKCTSILHSLFCLVLPFAIFGSAISIFPSSVSFLPSIFGSAIYSFPSSEPFLLWYLSFLCIFPSTYILPLYLSFHLSFLPLYLSFRCIFPSAVSFLPLYLSFLCIFPSSVSFLQPIFPSTYRSFLYIFPSSVFFLALYLSYLYSAKIYSVSLDF